MDIYFPKDSPTDPFGFSGFHIQAGDSLFTKMNVAETVQNDGTGHVAFLSVFPYLFEFLLLSIFSEIEKQGFTPVTTGENSIINDCGREDIHAPKRLDWLGPDFLARLWIYSSQV